MSNKIINLIIRHKIKTAVLFLLVLAGGYFGYKALKNNNEEVRYVLAAVEKGTIIVSVSGSGQISSSNEIDLKPKVSGEVVYVGVKANQEVKSGTLIAQLNTRDAEKAIKDAEIDLAEAELDLANAEESTGESLTEACEDGLNTLTDTFKSLSPITQDLGAMFTESSYDGDQNDIDYYIRTVRAYDSSYQLSFWQGGAEDKYVAVKKEIKTIQDNYSKLTKDSPRSDIENVVNQTYGSVKNILELIRQSYNLVQNYQTLLEEENITSPVPSDSTDSQSSLLEDYLSSLISVVNNLSSAKKALVDAKADLSQSDLDIETQKSKVKQCQYALADARESLSQRYIYAPFDGEVTEVNIEKGDSVSASTALINFVTKQKIAEITLNEVDVAKVELGQKATISFDAIEDLTIVGEVAEIDAVGTVSQGVVTYDIKVIFDSQDERIKSGMSVSVSIITEIKQDVFTVSNSAIKTQNNAQYVQIMKDDGTVYFQEIEIGISNDTNTEVLSGLSEGDKVITQTVSNNSSKSNTSSGNSGSMPSGGGSMEIMRIMQ